MRAFRFAHDSSANLNSGVEHHNADKICCVLVKSSRDRNGTSKSKNMHMLVCKFQRFRKTTCSTPLELSLPLEKVD